MQVLAALQHVDAGLQLQDLPLQPLNGAPVLLRGGPGLASLGAAQAGALLPNLLRGPLQALSRPPPDLSIHPTTPPSIRL